MKNRIATTASIFSATVMMLTASPAIADDSAVDTESMTEAMAPSVPVAVDLPIAGFDLKAVSGSQNFDFMATAAKKNQPGYRIDNQPSPAITQPTSGLTSLLVPEEYSYRSSEQDSGVYPVIPGRFLSSSIRADYLTDTGPAARDKSSVGLRLPF
ncbi:hypothetical protein [Parasphingorhabdus sp.]|uniref:hypothetical protein n=1 Tax=Parasphingorhabdus sp. TaxID=2709688 RepID=UPI00326755B5